MGQGKATVIVVVAILLAFAAVVIASTPSGSDGAAGHTMPDGGTMQGERMP